MKQFKLKEPFSDQEFDAYYQCRWEVLRKPWNQPKGSEKDEFEDEAYHLMAVNEKNQVCGIARMNIINDNTAQIRYMGVSSSYNGKGIGASLLHYLENLAKAKGIAKIMLQSREIAVQFYKKSGFEVVRKSHLLWGEIQHFEMEKSIN